MRTNAVYHPSSAEEKLDKHLEPFNSRSIYIYLEYMFIYIYIYDILHYFHNIALIVLSVEWQQCLEYSSNIRSYLGVAIAGSADDGREPIANAWSLTAGFEWILLASRFSFWVCGILEAIALILVSVVLSKSAAWTKLKLRGCPVCSSAIECGSDAFSLSSFSLSLILRSQLSSLKWGEFAFFGFWFPKPLLSLNIDSSENSCCILLSATVSLLLSTSSSTAILPDGPARWNLIDSAYLLLLLSSFSSAIRAWDCIPLPSLSAPSGISGTLLFVCFATWKVAINPFDVGDCLVSLEDNCSSSGSLLSWIDGLRTDTCKSRPEVCESRPCCLSSAVCKKGDAFSRSSASNPQPISLEQVTFPFESKNVEIALNSQLTKELCRSSSFCSQTTTCLVLHTCLAYMDSILSLDIKIVPAAFVKLSTLA